MQKTINFNYATTWVNFCGYLSIDLQVPPPPKKEIKRKRKKDFFCCITFSYKVCMCQESQQTIHENITQSQKCLKQEMDQSYYLLDS